MAGRNYEDNRVVNYIANTALTAGGSVDSGWVALPQAFEYFARVLVSNTDADVTITVETAEDNAGTGATAILTATANAAGVYSAAFDYKDIPSGHKYVRVTLALAATSTTGANVAEIFEAMRYAFKPASGVDTVAHN